MQSTREKFSSRLGFVLAAAGSAVGIGNLVGFPVAAAKNGGGAFLLLYCLFILLICLPLMLAELGIGRHTDSHPAGAYLQLGEGKRRWHLAGWLAVLTPFMIAVFYTVITVWIFGFLFHATTGDLALLAENDYFGKFINQDSFLLYLVAVTLLINLILMGGVQKGIERASKTLMPLLFVMMIALTVYVLSLKGASVGLRFYLLPDFSHFDLSVLQGALSQAFFSLSLGMGIMLTYGSYFRKQDNLPQSGKLVAATDTLVAFIAGLLTLPAIFAIFPEQDPQALSDSSVSLVFNFFPKIFMAMAGDTSYLFASVLASLFFLLVLIAAVTSLVSIVEVPVAAMTDVVSGRRKLALAMVSALITVLTVLAALSFGRAESLTNLMSYGGATKSLFDFIVDLFYDTILPINGLLLCLLIRSRWRQNQLAKTLGEGAEDYPSSLLSRYVNGAIAYAIPLVLLVVSGLTIQDKFF